MCRCSQDARGHVKRSLQLLNQARYFLCLARREKQRSEIAKEFYEGNAPHYLAGFALEHGNKARDARLSARSTLIEIEKKYGKAYMNGVRPLPVSANKLGGYRFHCWEAYRKVFGQNLVAVDTWA